MFAKCKHKMPLDNSIVIAMMKFLMLVKYYHWSTDSYNRHKITDEFYATLNTLVDNFVETYQGISGSVVPMGIKVDLSFDSYTDESFISRLHMFLDYITKIRTKLTEPELANILDEITAEVQKVIYLARFD